MPAPGGRRELDEVIGNVASTPLDRSRPLWEFHFAEGMADHRFAIIGKMHHALADGVASANLLARVMDLDGPVQDERDNERLLPPSTAELLRAAGRDHAQQVAALPGVIIDALAGCGGCGAAPANVASSQILPDCCTRRRRSSTTWSHRCELSLPRRCRSRR